MNQKIENILVNIKKYCTLFNATIIIGIFSSIIIILLTYKYIKWQNSIPYFINDTGEKVIEISPGGSINLQFSQAMHKDTASSLIVVNSYFNYNDIEVSNDGKTFLLHPIGLKIGDKFELSIPKTIKSDKGIYLKKAYLLHYKVKEGVYITNITPYDPMSSSINSQKQSYSNNSGRNNYSHNGNTNLINKKYFDKVENTQVNTFDKSNGILPYKVNKDDYEKYLKIVKSIPKQENDLFYTEWNCFNIENNNISLTFDKDIIADNKIKFNNFLKFKPSLEGTYSFPQNNVLVFTPNNCQANELYTIFTDENSILPNGLILDDYYKWHFQTPDLNISFSYTKEQNTQLQTIGIIISESFALDKLKKFVKIEKTIKLKPNNEENPFQNIEKEEVQYQNIDDFILSPGANNKEFIISPKDKWDLGNIYRISVSKEIGLKDNTYYNFITDDDFFETSEITISPLTSDLNQQINISFNNILAEDSISEVINNVIITPPVNISSWINYGNSQIAQVILDGDTEYTIEIKDNNLKDIYGHSLTGKTHTFKTEPLKDYISFNAQTTASFYSHYDLPKFKIKSANINETEFILCKIDLETYVTYNIIDQFSNGYSENIENYYNGIPEEKCEKIIKWKTELGEKNKIFTKEIDISEKIGRPATSGFWALSIKNPIYEKLRNQKESIINPPIRDNYSSSFKKDNNNKYEYWTSLSQNLENQNPMELFMITDSHLVMKQDNNGKILLWATDIGNGDPIKGLNLRLRKYLYSVYDEVLTSPKYNPRDKDIDLGMTNNEGFLEFNLPDSYKDNLFLIVGSNSKYITYLSSNWDDGIKSWNFGLEEQSDKIKSKELLAHIYTDRKVYRPKHTVYFKAIMKIKINNNTLSNPDFKEASVTIFDTDNNQLYQKKLPLNNYGAVYDSFLLGDKAKLGDYKIEILPISNYYPDETRYGSFNVQEYKKSTFKVDITNNAENYFNEETAEIKVSSEYFFGAPVPKAKIKWRLTTKNYYEKFLYEDNYNYGYHCYGCYDNIEDVLSGEAETDNTGNYIIKIPLDISNKGQDQEYNIEIQVIDNNGQEVANNKSFIVRKDTKKEQKNFKIGLLPSSPIYNLNDDVKIAIKAINLDGNIFANEKIDLKLIRRNWTSIQKENIGNNPLLKNDYEDEIISEQIINLKVDGNNEVNFKPDKGGVYIVQAFYQEQLKTESFFDVADLNNLVPWPVNNNHKLDLVLDKAVYNIGDKAKLLIKSPYENTKALITLERDSIIEKEIINIDKNSYIYEFNISEKHFPNAFISVLLLKSSTEHTPSFKMGISEIKVQPKIKQLNIKIATNKNNYQPGEKVIVEITTTNQSGQTVPAEVSLAAVDESVIRLMGDVNSNLFETFYKSYKLGVKTYINTLAILNKQYFATYGGSGKGYNFANIPLIRSVFKDTAYWNESIYTNEQGVAKIEFNLPHDLTTFELLAIGMTNDTYLFGNSKKTIKIQKDLLIEPLLPRILRKGDKITLKAKVHNYTNKEQNLFVKLHASNILRSEAESLQQITIPSNEKKDLAWDITVPKEIDNMDITIKADNKEVNDAIVINLPVYGVSSFSLISGGGKINKNLEEYISLPINASKDMGDLEISFSNSNLTNIKPILKELIIYPYGCAEQSTSSTVPNAVAGKLLNTLAIQGFSKDEAAKNVEAGLKRLAGYQNDDGGFSLWGNSDSEQYLSSYVLWGYYIIEKSGYKVDQIVIKKAKEYLLKSFQAEYENDYHNFDETMKVSALFTLSELAEADEINVIVKYLDPIQEKSDTLNIFSKSQMAMAYHNISLKTTNNLQKAIYNEKVNKLKSDILNKVKIDNNTIILNKDDNNGYYMNTPLRDIAIMLQMLIRVDFNNEKTEIIQSYLMSKNDVSDGFDAHRTATQEKIMIFIAFTEYFEKSKKDYQSFSVNLSLNNTEEVIEFTDKFKEFDKKYLIKNIISSSDMKLNLQNPSGNTVYYNWVLKYFPEDVSIVPEKESGYTISRDYFDKITNKPLEKIKLGEAFKIKVAITVKEKQQYIAVEDYLPAGVEAINPELNISASEYKIKEPAECYWDCNSKFTHKEFRDDRVFLFANELEAGTYSYEYYAKATNKGIFSLPPAQVYSMYNLEKFANTAGRKIEIYE